MGEWSILSSQSFCLTPNDSAAASWIIVLPFISPIKLIEVFVSLIFVLSCVSVPSWKKKNPLTLETGPINASVLLLAASYKRKQPCTRRDSSLAWHILACIPHSRSLRQLATLTVAASGNPSKTFFSLGFAIDSHAPGYGLHSKHNLKTKHPVSTKKEKRKTQ